jgi:two-component system sensor histidine kinase VicK
MVNNIIDVNRIESGVFKVNERNCDIVRIIRDITSSADVYAGMKKIKLSFNSNKDNCIIACDPFLLERILLNLLSNSIKFTPVGGIIAINLNIMSEKVAITVTDSGRGIPVKYQNSIFDCFSQTDGECIIEKKGSGLGLYLVKKLIEKMGGEIRLVSKEGEGSTFTFYLPAKKQPNPRVEKTGNMIVHERNELLQIEFSDIHEV